MIIKFTVSAPTGQHGCLQPRGQARQAATLASWRACFFRKKQVILITRRRRRRRRRARERGRTTTHPLFALNMQSSIVFLTITITLPDSCCYIWVKNIPTPKIVYSKNKTQNQCRKKAICSQHFAKKIQDHTSILLKLIFDNFQFCFSSQFFVSHALSGSCCYIWVKIIPTPKIVYSKRNKTQNKTNVWKTKAICFQPFANMIQDHTSILLKQHHVYLW